MYEWSIDYGVTIAAIAIHQLDQIVSKVLIYLIYMYMYIVNSYLNEMIERWVDLFESL